jgi:hypothetical protein
MKQRLVEKLNGRSMTFVGTKLIEAWLAGDLKFQDDDTVRTKRRA